MMSAYWWNITGNMGVLTDEGNSYFRWYMPADEKHPVGSQIARAKYVDKDGKTQTYSVPCFGFTPNHDFFHSKNTNATVLVYDMAFSTETQIPNLNIKLHVRDGGDKSEAAFSLNNGVLKVAGKTVLEPGITTADLTVKDGEWNDLSVVVYVDPSVN
jgi:hypothetical protein